MTGGAESSERNGSGALGSDDLSAFLLYSYERSARATVGSSDFFSRALWRLFCKTPIRRNAQPSKHMTETIARAESGPLLTLLAMLLLAAMMAGGCGQDPPTTSPAQDTGAVTPQRDSMTVDRVLRTDNRFATLVAGLDSTGLDSILAGSGPYTLFAPPDSAFSALPAGTVPLLMTEEVSRLRAILAHHVVDGRVRVTALSDSAVLPTLNGDSLRVYAADSSRAVQGATVVDGDVEVANGLIHVIDRVLRPPSGEE